jgi:hypothetical protein
MTCNIIRLGQDWTVEELNTSGFGSIYLAGPKSTENNSWRDDFIKKIKNTGLQITFLIPESTNNLSQDESYAWQKSAISAASAVVFWFPNGIIDIQSLVEFGIWCKSERVFLGGNGPEIKFLDWMFHTEQKINAANTIEQLTERVVHWLLG